MGEIWAQSVTFIKCFKPLYYSICCKLLSHECNAVGGVLHHLQLCFSWRPPFVQPVSQAGSELKSSTVMTLEENCTTICQSELQSEILISWKDSLPNSPLRVERIQLHKFKKKKKHFLSQPRWTYLLPLYFFLHTFFTLIWKSDNSVPHKPNVAHTHVLPTGDIHSISFMHHFPWRWAWQPSYYTLQSCEGSTRHPHPHFDVLWMIYHSIIWHKELKGRILCTTQVTFSKIKYARE